MRALSYWLWALTLLLFTIAWPTLSLTHDVPTSLRPVVAAAGVAPLLLLRRHPFLGWALWCAGGMVVPVLFRRQPGYDFPWQVTAFLVLLALLVAVGVRESRRALVTTWVATTALCIAFLPGELAPGWVFGLTAVLGVGLLARWLLRSQRELAQQTDLGELERARRTIAEERTRIARDLHDVVAHRMSMVVVQAQSAPYRFGGVDPQVSVEFTAIADQAREALNEVRGLLGVLRSDGQLAEDVPQPGIADALELLREAREAGLDLRWDVEGDPDGCGTATAMVTYRILQESLANASRHAPGAEVQVDLDLGPTVVVRVRNGLSSRTPEPGTHAGNGILGMQFRAASVGGSLSAGPSEDGGFEVRATLPARATVRDEA